jgi:rod shape determining protein RodA
MIRRLSFRDLDWPLLFLALTIAAIGIFEIYSTTAHTAMAGHYQKQIYWTLLGCVAALVISRLDYHFLVEHVPWLYIAGVVGLIAVLMIGHSMGGARRWLKLGGPVSFQVSELIKLVIILLVAAYFAPKRGNAVTWRDLLKVGVLVALPAVLVALEPDLGTALTLLPIAAAGFFLGGISMRQVGVILLLGVLALPVGWQFLKPYQRDRLESFIHPTQDSQRSGYQGSQAKIAIGSGGFWGKGTSHGTQSRLGFIPVSRTDFIFASFAEEQGFLGTVVVFLLYVGLLLRLLDCAQLAGDRSGTFLIVGLASLLFFQAAVNIGMMIGFLPITGIPLPLMSQGGSSTLATFLGLGMAMSVKMRRFVN